jgi:hypothetical protein
MSKKETITIEKRAQTQLRRALFLKKSCYNVWNQRQSFICLYLMVKNREVLIKM